MERTHPHRLNFTDKKIAALKFVPSGQEAITDLGSKCLSLVIGKRTKSFRSAYRFRGKWVSRTLGEHGAFVPDAYALGDNPSVTIDVAWARERVLLDQKFAKQNVDPKTADAKMTNATADFATLRERYLPTVVDQRSFRQTKHILEWHCRGLDCEPLGQITRDMVQERCINPLMPVRDAAGKLVRAGKSRSAQLTLSKLKTLWLFAINDEGYQLNPLLLRSVKAPHVQTSRARTYSDAELKGLWDAAGKLGDVERDYVRLLVLLIPRKKALAHMQREHLNLTAKIPVWVTPNSLTKSKPNNQTRTYRTPLPPLALSLLRQRLNAIGDGTLLFPGRGNVPISPGSKFSRSLVKLGAPSDFGPHQLRHVVTSWLEDDGANPYERSLVLNHKQGGVTSVYSHGSPDVLKLEVLTRWESHVREVVGLPVTDSAVALAEVVNPVDNPPRPKAGLRKGTTKPKAAKVIGDSPPDERKTHANVRRALRVLEREGKVKLVSPGVWGVA